MILFLYILPGLALLALTWRGRSLSWAEQIGLAAGLSVALHPILLLWTHVLGLAPGRLLAWIPGVLAVIVLAYRYRHAVSTWEWRRDWPPTRAHLPDAVLVVLVVLLLVSRLLPVRSMTAPAWGDSVQHTVIVQLLLDHGGLFQSWEPYAPMQSFTYHFGFHVDVALWSWMSGLPAPDAVLLVGQILNVLAVLALYPLATRLASGNRWVGVATVLVAGILSPMPAFYVNWGRYTQLAGQVILPIVVWALDVWWTDTTRPSPRLLLLLSVALAGLALTHYRITLITVAAAVGWGLWGLWVHRHDVREWLTRALLFVGTGLLAVALVLPWMLVVREGRLASVHVAIAQRAVDRSAVRQELKIWRSLSTYVPRPLWLAGIGAGALALWKRRRLALPLLLWTAVTFLITNPFLLRLPGTGWITNFALIIALYVPIGLVLGWLLGAVWKWLTPYPNGYTVLLSSLLLLTLLGLPRQLRIVDPSFQMLTPADVQAFRWIEEHVPSDATFLVNGFLAYNDSLAVGSDAGWWLPLYTLRQNTLPPLLYGVEKMPTSTEWSEIRDFVVAVRDSNGDATALRHVLCRGSVTHVYLGQKRGTVGLGAAPLIPETWLRQNDSFALLHTEDRAQIWVFDHDSCTQDLALP